MALINTTPNTPINHPSKEGVTLSNVAAVYLIPSQPLRESTSVEVELYRACEIGEEGPYSKMVGYTQINECGPHYIGQAPTNMNSPTYGQDIHDFAISVLGSNFQKI